MPDPRTPMGTWARDLIGWNQGGGGSVPDYESYSGLDAPSADQMSQIQKIIMSLFSDSGMKRYRAALGEARNPIKEGIKTVKKKRDPGVAADWIINQDLAPTPTPVPRY